MIDLRWVLLLTASAAPHFGVGRVATASEIAAQDISVLPTGQGLPKGHGTAREGKSLFLRLCAPCHGANGQGSDDFPQLIGGRGTLTSAEPVLTVGSYWPYATTIWDYVHRAMPYVAPGTLTPNEVYALTAYLLHANQIIGPDTVMDEQSLPRVKMPNRDGFVGDPRPDVHRERATPKPGAHPRAARSEAGQE